MSDLQAAAQQAIALICSARLCEINSMSSRQEMLRLLIEATDTLRAALDQPNICTWHGDEEGTYETSCKHLFQVIDGTPDGNGFKNCCFCGLWLESHPWEDGNE